MGTANLPAIIVIFFFVLSFSKIFAQEKLPNIQAICKVTLEGGQSHEGIISLGYSYDNKHYHSHAFYIQKGDDHRLIQIDLRFEAFYMAAFSDLPGAEVFYAQSKSNTPKSIHSIDESSGVKILTKKTLRQESYSLLKELVIRQEVPESLHINAGTPKQSTQLNIQVEKLISFKLLKNPSEKWIKGIENKRALLKKKMEQDRKKGNFWPNYREPLWLHELVKDHQRFVILSSYFE